MKSIRFAVGALLALFFLSGCSGGGGSDRSDPVSDPRLQRFTDCAELRSYLAATVRTEAQLRGIYGAGDAMAGGGPLAPPGQAEAAADGEPPEYTGTNVQEAGVDEPDFLKTDGRYLYLVSGGYFLIFEAWPADQTRELVRVELEGSPFELLLHGDTALVLSRLWNVSELAPEFSPNNWEVLKLSLFDLSDRARPRLLRETVLEGSYVDGRMIDSRAHLVISSALTTWTDPQIFAPSAGAGAAESEIFPRVFDKIHGEAGSPAETEVLCSCDNVFRPEESNGLNQLTLVTVDLADPQGELRSVSVLGASGIVYASAESLYVAAANTDVWLWQEVASGERREPLAGTMVHKFTLGPTPAYAASGAAPGWALNQFSLGEHQGVLRLATTEPRWWSGESPENRVVALRQVGGRLETVGSLGGLGKPGESIYAVRFLGERGFVVTFERTDPLYALDLSDPAAPKVAGTLEVPGFSTYLHPLAGERLLAVGRDGSALKLSLFDVSDPAAPREINTLTEQENSSSTAEYDHQAFTYFEREGVLALPLTVWGASAAPEAFAGYDVFAGLALYRVDAAAGFAPLGRVDHADFFQDRAEGLWYQPEAVARSLFIGEAGNDFLYSVSPRGVKVTPLADLEQEVAALPLPAEEIWWIVGDLPAVGAEPAPRRAR